MRKHEITKHKNVITKRWSFQWKINYFFLHDILYTFVWDYSVPSVITGSKIIFPDLIWIFYSPGLKSPVSQEREKKILLRKWNFYSSIIPKCNPYTSTPRCECLWAHEKRMGQRSSPVENEQFRHVTYKKRLCSYAWGSGEWQIKKGNYCKWFSCLWSFSVVSRCHWLLQM